jgi:predicted Zn-ribbon and HTH transcriptional regulator
MVYRINDLQFATPDAAIHDAITRSRFHASRVVVTVEDGPQKRILGRADHGEWRWASPCKRCGGRGIQVHPKTKIGSTCPRCAGEAVLYTASPSA